jgi:small subunit ribosomal protein S20
LARHKSAEKRNRQSVKRRATNRAHLSQVKTQARTLLPETMGQIDKASRKGVLHDNAAARYKSRLTRKVTALSAAKA